MQLRERRREQIVAAAAIRFADQGFHRSSMQDVITESGLSPGAVYRYFRSKDEIIEAIVHESMGTVARAVDDSFESGETLADVMAVLPETLTRLQPGNHRVRLAVQSWGESLRNATLAASMRAEAERIRQALAAQVRRAQDAGQVRDDVDTDEIARALLGLLQGFVLQYAWDPAADPAAYGMACRSLVDGLEPDGAQSS